MPSAFVIVDKHIFNSPPPGKKTLTIYFPRVVKFHTCSRHFSNVMKKAMKSQSHI